MAILQTGRHSVHLISVGSFHALKRIRIKVDLQKKKKSMHWCYLLSHLLACWECVHLANISLLCPQDCQANHTCRFSWSMHLIWTCWKSAQFYFKYGNDIYGTSTSMLNLGRCLGWVPCTLIDCKNSFARLQLIGLFESYWKWDCYPKLKVKKGMLF